MNSPHLLRAATTLLAAAALVVSGAAPAIAQDPEPSLRLTMPGYSAGLDLDASGMVYVADPVGDVVRVFDPGATTPSAVRVLTGLDNPLDVAVMPGSGEVLVANCNGNNVLVFDPSATTPNTAKTRTGVGCPSGLAINQAGNLLVSSLTDARIYGFVGASPTPVGSFDSTVIGPMGIALHPSTGDLYVPAGNGAGVAVFDRGTTVPNPAKAMAAADNPRGIAFHPANGWAYVARFGSTASVFRAGGVVADPASELTGLTSPWGVAVSPSTGRVYVSENGGVEVYAPPSPVVASVAPAAGPVSGGTTVTLAGANLGMVSAVRFGGTAGTIVGTPGYTSLQVTAPAVASAGPVTVEVTATGATAGKVDAFTYTAVAPGKATGVSGTAGNAQVTVSWTAPASTGGVPLTGYVVTPTPSGTPCSAPVGTTSCTITGLTNGLPYTFAVTATNSASLSTASDPSAAVTPYVPISQKVKAKGARSKLPRKGYATVVNWVKKPSYADRVVSTTCTNPTGLPSAQLCRFTVSRNGKVKVRTKGYRNVRVQVTIQSVPKSGAPVQYGPSTTWTRTWRVR